MALDLTDCQFAGPALPEPFVRFELEKELTKLKLLAKTTGKGGKQLKQQWDVYRRHLAQLAVRGGPVRVRHHTIEPIVRRLGYDDLTQQDPVDKARLRQARVTKDLREQARKAVERFIQEAFDRQTDRDTLLATSGTHRNGV